MKILSFKILFMVFVFLYLFAYGIKVANVPLTIFISIASIIYIFLNRLSIKFINIWFVEIILIIFIFCYLLLVEIAHGVPASLGNFSFYVIRILIDGILPAYAISDFSKKAKINISEFVFILFLLIIFQLFFSIMMIVSPYFKSTIFPYFINDIHSVLFNQELFYKRGFGIAYTYLAWFPFAVALIFSFCLFCNSIKSKIVLSLLFISTLILVTINARIGFIPIFLSIFFYTLFNGIQGAKKIVYLFFIIFLAFYVFSILDLSENIDNLLDVLIKWVIDDGFASIFSYQGSQTLKDLSNFRIFSDFSSLNFVFGKGSLLVPENIVLYTDVGYMQILFTGGLFLSITLYALFFLFGLRLIKYVRILRLKGIIPNVFFYFSFVVCISFLIAHGKLRVFEMNEATRFILLIISFFMVFTAKSSVVDFKKVQH